MSQDRIKDQKTEFLAAPAMHVLHRDCIRQNVILSFFCPARKKTEKNSEPYGSELGFLVAPTGFEPATSALRGRRPKPLDDGATYVLRCRKWLGWEESNPHIRHQKPLSYH